MYNSSSVSLYTPDSLIYNKKEFSDKFQKGKKIARDQKVIITGLVRDVSDKIPFIKKKVESVGSQFKDYRVLIVENDSKDDTRDLLLKWTKENPKVIILGCGINFTGDNSYNDSPVNNKKSHCHISFASKKTEGHPVSYGRIEKMVHLRNIYLDHIKNNKEYHNFDYTIMWDFDTVGVVYIDGILSTIYAMNNKNINKNINKKINIDDISGVCAYGIYRWMGNIPIYYDTYAHIDYGDNFNLNNKMEHDIKKGFGYGVLRSFSPQAHQDLIPVKSCFSGFTIYRTKDLLPSNVKYTMTPSDIVKSTGNIECEHVRLSETLPSHMYMAPDMINLVLLNN